MVMVHGHGTRRSLRKRACTAASPESTTPHGRYQYPVLYSTGKKTPGGAGTHTGHTGHTGARGHTDHTDEPHNEPPKPNDSPTRPRDGRNRDRGLNSRKNSRRPGVDRSPYRYPYRYPVPERVGGIADNDHEFLRAGGGRRAGGLSLSGGVLRPTRAGALLPSAKSLLEAPRSGLILDISLEPVPVPEPTTSKSSRCIPGTHNKQPRYPVACERASEASLSTTLHVQ